MSVPPPPTPPGSWQSWLDNPEIRRAGLIVGLVVLFGVGFLGLLVVASGDGSDVETLSVPDSVDIAAPGDDADDGIETFAAPDGAESTASADATGSDPAGSTPTTDATTTSQASTTAPSSTTIGPPTTPAASADDPPTTPPSQAPATDPPTTQPPATDPPTTQAPATDPPTTQPPTTAAPTTQPPTTQPPTTQPPVGGSAEQQILALVNTERAAAGCPALSLNGQLNAAAYAHSQDMAANNYFSHTGLNGSQPWDRAQAAGYGSSFIGENIAQGYRSAESVMQGWMNSSGHRANILNCSYTNLGVGLSNQGWYWTQLFGG